MSETPDSTTIPVLVLRENAIGSNMPPVAVGVRVSGLIKRRCFGIMNAKICVIPEICKFISVFVPPLQLLDIKKEATPFGMTSVIESCYN